MNLIPEVMELDSAKSRVSLYEVPGYSLFCTLPDSPTRGEIVINGRLFVVAGATFFEVKSDETFSNYGTVANDGTPVSMTASATQVLIASGGACYAFNLAANTFTTVTVAVSGTAYNIQAAPNGLAVYFTTLQISSISETGNTVSATFASSLSGMSPAPPKAGDIISIQGVTPTGFNGTFAIVSVSGNTLTMTNATSGLGTGSAAALPGLMGCSFYWVEVNLQTNTAVSASVGQNIVIAAATDASYDGTWTIAATSQIFTGGGNYYWQLLCHATSAIAQHGPLDPGPPQPTIDGVHHNSSGTLTPGPYAYQVTHITGSAESLPCAVTNVTVTDNFVSVTANGMLPGCTAKVYGRVSGGIGLLGTTNTGTFNDFGTIAPGAAPPAATGGGTATTQNSTAVAAKQAGYCDGFFLRFLASSNQFFASATLDATTWDLTDTAKISTIPDNIVSMIVDHREVWFLGGSKSVVYGNSGNVFPFDVTSGGYIEQGSSSTFGPIRADNSIFWIGADDRGQLMGWRADGYRPLRVSNYAVETAWQGYSTASDAVSWTYQENGHTFWVIEFPTANATWVYDISTGMWHERGKWNGSTYDSMQIWCHAFAFGKHLVGDRTNGKLYQMSSSITGYLGDGGTALRWDRMSPWISQESTWAKHSSLQFDISGGTINLRWTDDGGNTWSSVHTVTVSANQGNLTRAIFRRLGRSRGRIYEAYGTTPVKIIDAYLKASGYDQPTERLADKMRQMA